MLLYNGKKISAAIFSIIVLFSCNSYAGAWLNNEGEFSIINTGYYYKYSQFQDSNGDKQDSPDFIKYEYKPYIEYGVNEKWGVIFFPSFQAVASEAFNATSSNEDKNQAFVFSELGLKRLLYKSEDGNQAISLIATTELPGVYEEATTPFFGKNETFWSAVVSAGTNLYKIGRVGKERYSFANLETGIRSRLSDSFTGESGSQYKLDFVVSFPISSDFKKIFGDTSEVGFGFNYVKSLSGYSNPNIPYLNRFGYDAAQISLNQRFKYLGLEFDYGAIYQFYARNTGIGEGFKLSITKRF
jgi:hypothetical protein